MPWDRPEVWDRATLRTYGALAAARRDHEALRRGGLRWAYVDDDALVFLREHPAGSVLVLARRAGGSAVDLPAGTLGLADGSLLLATEDGRAPGLRERRGVVRLPASDGPGVWVWRV
jgi:alpha-glucosidase